MPPRVNSRHSFTEARLEAASGKLLLGPRVPFRYLDRPDNRVHVVRSGDTLWNLARRYFSPLARLPLYSSSMLYWVIMDFQPTPILDPTRRLADGSTLVIPSVATVVDRVLGAPGGAG